MKSTALILLFLLVALPAAAQSPHGELDADCGSCHTAEDWKKVELPEDFDHDEFDFPLRGAHRGVECGQCHEGMVFGGVSSECIGCHADVHEGELGLDCERCHGTVRFIDRGDQLRLHRYTRFPLSGSHYSLDCAACHPPGGRGQLRWVNTPADCQSCHLDDYQTARDPDHVAGNFSRECELCHSPTLWQGANFNHASTGFPLDGEHAEIDCTECHTSGGFGGLDPACNACHQDDYLATTDPDHTAMGFGIFCDDCHNTTRWEGAVFDHDGRFFPIYAGRHAQEWNACVDCHTNPSNYRDFSCLGCHPHSDRNETDGQHREEANGYVYESRACYDCHPRGRGED